MRRSPMFTVAAAGGLALGPVLLFGLFPLAAGAAEDGDEHTFVVEMTGEAERPDPGDPDGTGTATLTIDVDEASICYTLEVAAIDPAKAAHIHEAGPDAAGPIVVPLEEVPSSGMSSGCADVEQDLITDILEDPSDYYVNVHNVEFPAGAVRGQLTQMPEGGVATGAGGTAGDDRTALLLAGGLAVTVGAGAVALVARRGARD